MLPPKSFTNSLGMKMKRIRPGSFIMYEAMIVTLTHHYWLAEKETTQAQWMAVMGSNPSKFRGDNLPVEQVRWDEAVEFCRKLTSREKWRLPRGYVYALPTDAQWAFAAFDQSTGEISRGDNWHTENSRNEAREVITHEVGQQKPNARGFYDMFGNAGEWCRDAWTERLIGGTDPETVEGPERLFRIGSSGVQAIFTGTRNRAKPDQAWPWLGFRVALVRQP